MATLAWMLLAFVIAAAGTWLARAYALRNALLDHPGERRSHAVPTPRGGGVAIVLAMLPLLAWLAWRQPEQAGGWGAIGGGLLLVAGIGWLDDHRPLGPAPRLLVHAFAAALLAWALHAFGGTLVVAAIGFVLALVLVNVWNFMDGIDSLAASQAMLAALGYALFDAASQAWLPAMVLVAACAGFLPFNLPRARIFLGDIGSGALGFLLAALASLLLLELPLREAPVLLLPLLVFGVDAGLTLFRRIVRGERWWEPHVQHAYQAWARRRGHGRVALACFLASALAVALMLCVKDSAFIVIMSAVGLSCVAACLAWWRLQQGPGPKAGEGG